MNTVVTKVRVPCMGPHQGLRRGNHRETLNYSVKSLGPDRGTAWGGKNSPHLLGYGAVGTFHI